MGKAQGVGVVFFGLRCRGFKGLGLIGFRFQGLSFGFRVEVQG